jgi:hypothetical protein
MGLSDQSSASTPLAIHSPRSALFGGTLGISPGLGSTNQLHGRIANSASPESEEVASTLTELSQMNAAWGFGGDSS